MITDNLTNPYPGLRPFSIQERDLFFGRTDEREILLSLALAGGFVAVTGLPGSGKSSLALCGVAGTLVNDKGWYVVTMTPGNDPVESLINSLAKAGGESKQDEIREAMREMVAGNCTLPQLVEAAGIGKEKRVLFIADQFEEIFSDAFTGSDGKVSSSAFRFVSLLTGVEERKERDITAMIVIGTPYLGECARFHGLIALINRHSYYLPPIGGDALKEVITLPAAASGTEIDATLVDMLIAESLVSAVPLSVLQHLLMRMWYFWYRNGAEGKISMDHYKAAGTLPGALSLHADELFGTLDAAGKKICELFFKCVTGKNYDGTHLIRPERVSVICGIAGCSIEELEDAVYPFRDERNSFVWPGRVTVLENDTLTGITYPGLSGEWKQLSDWIEEEAEAARTYLDLSRMSELFQSGAAGLLKGGDLLRMIEWRDKWEPSLEWACRYNPAWERAIVYLVSSENEYNLADQAKEKIRSRKMRRFKYAASLLGVFAIVSAAAMTWSVWKGNQVKQESKLAVELAVRAVAAEQEALTSVAEVEEVVEQVSTRLEVVSRVAEESEMKSRVLEEEWEIARRETDQALDLAGEAILNELEAVEEARILQGKRMVSVARSLAVRSKLLNGKGDLQVLLAYQAYLFNQKNGGHINDPDIFAALYEVAKSNQGRGYTSFDNKITHGITSLAIPGSGRVYYASSAEGGVLSWSRNSNVINRVADTKEIITCLSSDNSGMSLACGTERSVVLLIPTRGGEMTELKGHSGRVSAVLWSPDNRYIYSSDSRGKIIRWDAQSHENVTLVEGLGGILSMDISPSGDALALSENNGSCSVWESNGTKSQLMKYNADKSINVVRFRNNDIIALGLEDGSVEFVSVNGGISTGRMECHNTPVISLLVNPVSDQLITAGADSLIKMWNLKDPSQLPAEINDFNGIVSSIAYRPDGQSFFAASVSGESSLREMPAQTGYIADGLCGVLSRNFTREEWARYVGTDIEYQETCLPGDLRIQIREIRGEQ